VSCIDQCASVDLAIDGYRETKDSQARWEIKSKATCVWPPKPV
jgi:hypothetical protein